MNKNNNDGKRQINVNSHSKIMYSGPIVEEEKVFERQHDPSNRYFHSPIINQRNQQKIGVHSDGAIGRFGQSNQISKSNSISPYSRLSSVYYPKIDICMNSRLLWMGKYQIREEIGKGNYGTVFLARDMTKEKKDVHKRVAIKVIKKEEDEEEDQELECEHKIFEKLQGK